MCEHEELTFVKELGPHGRYIDKCMVELIRDINKTGLQTMACCCGHGKYRKTIIVTHPEWTKGRAVELTLWMEIPRKRNYYKMDDEGYYYIPEVEEMYNQAKKISEQKRGMDPRMT